MRGLRIVPTDLNDPAHAAAFVSLLDAYARDPMGGGKALPDEVRTTLPQRLAGRAGFVSFLAFVDDEAVGLINCFEGFSTFAAQPLLNVHDIAVLPAHRRRGIARALLAAAEEAARERGCCKLTLEVLSNNHAAMAAYAQQGFAPYELDPAAGRAVFLQKRLQAG
ncbi:GNAT family N-acetyltransferase [Pseudazoarcus pumilus]|uniref:GNAT family N-acetyltransferase n=2 Tax=Pseudazoarcus pumilus TaxID=2067960 RepID=A0A2I6SB85_9RHOO|nr:GNAT family N-acetyltransferase [Pseudazoarcus pumilus]